MFIFVILRPAASDHRSALLPLRAARQRGNLTPYAKKILKFLRKIFSFFPEK